MNEEKTKLDDFLRKNLFAQNLKIAIKWEDRDGDIRVYSLSEIMGKMRDYYKSESEKAEEKLLPFYVEKVTTEFMNKVDSLYTQIDELQSSLSGDVF